MRAYLIKAVLLVFSFIPLPLSHLIGNIIGWLLYLVPNDLKRISMINLRLCLISRNPSSRRQLLRASLIETAKTAAELGPLWRWRKQRIMDLVQEVSGEKQVNQALAQGRGVVIAAPHLGAWEMVGLYCSLRFSMTSLYRPPRMKELDLWARTARERFGARLVPTDMSGIRALYRALSQGEAVGVLPDQEPAMGNGLFAPFYGIPAYSMTLLHRLVSRTGATVFYTYAERLPTGKGYHVHFVRGQPDMNQLEQRKALEAMNYNIEMCINAAPTQYQWSYKRFRKRPPGEAGFY